MPTLLRYAMKASEFPLQASSETGNLNVTQLTIVASNPNSPRSGHISYK